MITDSAAIHAHPDTVSILRFPGMASAGTYPAPVPFGGMGKPVNRDGYSDHFPVTVMVTEAD